MTLMSRNGLLNLIPDMRWVPHDIHNGEGSEKAHRSLWTRHLPGKGKAHRSKGLTAQSSNVTRADTNGFQMGRRRNSALTLTGANDPALDARTNNQMESTFFGKLPYELRIMIYEYMFGEGETIHLILGTKRKSYQHFICEEGHAEDDRPRNECSCKVLVGGRETTKLNPGLFNFIKACRRT